MKPTVGRVVLYTNLGDADGKYPPEQQAAIVTKVKTDKRHGFGCPLDGDPRLLPCEKCGPEETAYSVSLHIFYETGDFWMIDVPFSEEFKKGHWTWPPV